MTLHRGGPRVILGEGFKVYWGDIEDMQSLMYQEIYDMNIARLYGGRYGNMRSSYDMNRSFCNIMGILDLEARTRITARMGPNDCLLIPNNPGGSHKLDVYRGDILIYDITGAGTYDAKHTLIRIDTTIRLDTPINADGANEYYGAVYIKTEWEDFDSQSTPYKDVNTKIVTPQTIYRRRQPAVSNLIGVTALATGGSWTVVKAAVDALVPAGYVVLGYFQKTHGSAFLAGGETWNSMPSVQIAPALGGVDGHPANILHDGPMLPWTVSPIPAEGVVMVDVTGGSRFNSSGAIIRYVGGYIDEVAPGPATWRKLDNSIDWRHTLIWVLAGDYNVAADLRPGQAGEQINCAPGPGGALPFGFSDYVATADIDRLVNFGAGGVFPGAVNYYILLSNDATTSMLYLAVGDGNGGTEAGALYGYNPVAAPSSIYFNLVLMTIPALQLS